MLVRSVCQNTTSSMHKLMLNMGRQTLIYLLLAWLLLAAYPRHYSTVSVQAIESGKQAIISIFFYFFVTLQKCGEYLNVSNMFLCNCWLQLISSSNLHNQTQGLADLFSLLGLMERRFIKHHQDPTQLGITAHHPSIEPMDAVVRQNA
ncbi:hypothetical protein FEM48_Zijuj02G0078000 [Ziziphus jujuba var. spinosa]|uniref:Uncharacterized protein n=1 Tax=Ziziphus jujuba var. spinosa TaxID=714518 RepID=A0A978VUI3_ZIZJJ|nr:hypothetical protein FEM48_Zijuj02G0078000 [Ziziphus jujuba var. spinosa]